MPKLIQNNEFISGSPIMDATPQPNSTHAVQSGGVYTAFNNLSTDISAINGKIDELKNGSKNLFDITKPSVKHSSVSLVNNTLVFTNSNYGAYRYRFYNLANGTYTLSWNLALTSGSGYIGATKRADGTDTGLASKTPSTSGNDYLTFSVSGDYEYIEIAFCGAGSTSSGVFSYIMFENGNTASDYEEYYNGVVQLTSNLPKYKEMRYTNLSNSDPTKYYITVSNNFLNDIGDGATKCLSVTLSDWTAFNQTVLSLSAARDNALYLLFEKGTTFSNATMWIRVQYI